MCAATKRSGPKVTFNDLQVSGQRIPGMTILAMQNATGNTYRRKKSKWRGPAPVSAIEKVLTQDNRYADMMLSKQLRRIYKDRHHAEKLLEWHQQSFVVNQALKETELREMSVKHTSFLPELTMKLTEPDVRARRPFGRVSRRYADQIKDLKESTTHERSATLPEIALNRNNPKPHRLYRREQTDSFTRLHGINLPLYGPERDAEREERKLELVRKRQQAQKSKGLVDERFVELERSLTRNGREFSEAAWRHNRDIASGKNMQAEADEPKQKKVSKSAEILRRVQEQMASKPMTELAKSALVDFDL